MPFVRVTLFEGRTKAQKAELARAITEAVVTIAKTTPGQTHIVFEDVSRQDWAEAGVLASDKT